MNFEAPNHSPCFPAMPVSWPPVNCCFDSPLHTQCFRADACWCSTYSTSGMSKQRFSQHSRHITAQQAWHSTAGMSQHSHRRRHSTHSRRVTAQQAPQVGHSTAGTSHRTRRPTAQHACQSTADIQSKQTTACISGNKIVLTQMHLQLFNFLKMKCGCPGVMV